MITEEKILEIVHNEHVKLIKKFDVSENLWDDLYQEMLIAGFTHSDIYDRKEDSFSTWRYIARIRSAGIQFIKHENKFYKNVILQDPIESMAFGDRLRSCKEFKRIIKRDAALTFLMISETMTDREQEIMIFALNDTIDISKKGYQTELSMMYGVTSSRIGQIYAKMLRKLRHPRRSVPVKGFMELFNEIHDVYDELLEQRNEPT